MKPKYIFIIVLNAVSLLLFLLAAVLESFTEASLPDQHMSERWAGDKKYAQISLFTEDMSPYVLDGIFNARVDIDKKLVENSLSPENENSRLWVDAFSTTQMKAAVSSDKTTSEVSMIVTGGDFFMFHPQDMISGYYYSDDDTMHDRVVIDNVLAWQLYGASDIVGKPVIINGKYFYVAGVFRPSENSDSEKVYGSKPRLFMPYRGYELLGETPYFSCYEVCLPDPVTGLGKQIISDVIKMDKESYRLVENSSRYGLKNRFLLLRDAGIRSVVDIPIVYPYWENAARITEDRSVVLLILQILGLVFPAGTVLYFFRKLLKNRKKLAKKAFDKLKDLFGKIRRNSRKTPASPEKGETAVKV